MLWGIIIVVAIIAVCVDSTLGKVVFGAGALALGLLLVSWITDIGFFVTLAKGCAIVIVAVIVFCILAALADN